MATDRPRIQAYIDPDLYNRYQDWKKEKGFDKESPAINELLREFFGEKVQSEIASPALNKEDIEELIAEECEIGLRKIRQEAVDKLSTIPEINARVEAQVQTWMDEKAEDWMLRLGQKFCDRIYALEQKLQAVEDKLDIKDGMPSLLQEALHTVEQQRWVIEDLLSKSSGESPDGTRSPQEPPDIVQEQSQAESSDPESIEQGELPSELSSELTQTELAKRLDCNKSQISRKKGAPDFEEWTRERDPDAIGWRYDPVSKQYLALQALPFG